MANDLATSVKALLIDFLKPLQEAATNSETLAEWLATLGYDARISSDPALMPIVQRAPALVEKLAAFDTKTLESWTGVTSILACGRDVAAILQALRDFAAAPERKDIAPALAEEVMSYLLASYLRRRHPAAFRIGSLLTLVEPRETAPVDPAIVSGGTTMRSARVLDRFNFESINGLVTHPRATLETFYFPHGMTAGADAWVSAERVFPHLSFLAGIFGLSWRTDYRCDVAPSP